ncbi:MAG: hypothetical protein ACREJB_04615, partial [Planctomycetaceae bacterium]
MMPHARATGWIVAAVLIAGGAVAAGEPSRPDDESGFTGIVREHARRTLRDVDGYLARHPDAPDAERAWRWLFTTAREHRLEAEALAAAERYLSAQRDGDDAALAALARQVRCLALARSGKWEDALECFDAHLRTVRLRSADQSVEI